MDNVGFSHHSPNLVVPFLRADHSVVIIAIYMYHKITLEGFTLVEKMKIST